MTSQGLNFPEVKKIYLLVHILYLSNFTYRDKYYGEILAHVHKETMDKKVQVYFSTTYNWAKLETNYHSTRECKNTLQNIDTMEYYSSVKKKKNKSQKHKVEKK